ncbi:MAG: type II toxin-antitoxin system RelE/ParE family toxin [Candidatus Magasanikbacteria bacterium CG_4_10_14_0_2_um_filter_41_31]|uniref:Type II toxin-antitoxin system RelE/ParE family toxin n=1 Tax=Candidatus Magasanikbacteria bacterium CG_4_10_14_0_2_um_filter_41_31 TaxID=1974639 RepID=A0A2M7V3K9_9BACT|nr:MAG: type II toxin-antitoxin system RelE/ParE family toxin [Candidatus Magasanikbacteria bacterium CG_4_10_14_0_2_um_filter_41_31]
MNKNNFRILFGEDLEKFIFGLKKETIAKILRTIDLLENFGNKLSMPHSKKVIGNLFELRVRGQIEVRIFYVFYKETIVLLHGFVKKTQKIPVKELSIAQKKEKELDNI